MAHRNNRQSTDAASWMAGTKTASMTRVPAIESGNRTNPYMSVRTDPPSVTIQ